MPSEKLCDPQVQQWLVAILYSSRKWSMRGELVVAVFAYNNQERQGSSQAV
jgi:hypothetical protein